MGRAKRLHVPGGTYYLHLKANAGQQLFRDDEDVAAFNELVSAALARCDAQLYAFCWTRADARLALHISDVPLGRVVHHITAPYSRRVHRRVGQKGNLFTRYQTVLIASETYVLRLVRYIHLAPLDSGPITDAKAHRWSSHHIYLGEFHLPWVTVAPVLRILARHRGKGRDAYRRYMQEGVAASDAERFEGNHPYVPKSAAGEEWLQPRPLRQPKGEDLAPLDSLVDTVAKKLGVQRTDILSRSRSRRVSMARALIALHATRTGIATLSSVARYFRRHPSSLSEGLRRYSKEYAALFNESLKDPVSGGKKK